MKRNKIFIQGYGFSGSSLIRDYLYEFSNISHLKNHEFDLGRSSGGIYELGLLIENAWCWSLDSCIHRFYQLIDYLYEAIFKEVLGEEFKSISYNFINKIIEYKIKSSFLQFTPNEELRNPKKYIDKSRKNYKYYYKKYLFKVLNKYLLDDFFEELKEFNYHTDIYICKRMMFNEYIQIAKQYLIDIFCLFPKGKKIALVHPCNLIGYKIDSSLEYYDDNFKVIVIDKDPRDIFVAMQSKFKSNPATYLQFYSNVDRFIYDFKIARKYHEYNIKVLGDKGFFLTCEEFIQNYDETARKINEFLELDSNLHTNKCKIFNPEISIKNVASFKNYKNLEDINKIELSLTEYLKY